MANKDRADVFEFLNRYQKRTKKYIYMGFGSVLKHHRDNSMKDQDIDIVIDRTHFDKDLLNFLEKDMETTPWDFIWFDEKLVVAKFLYKKRTPIEFFLTDIKGKKQTTYIVYESKVPYKQVIDKVEIAEEKTPYGEVPMPKNKDKYCYNMYGENWKKPIKTSKYDYTKNSNSNTLISLKGKVKIKNTNILG